MSENDLIFCPLECGARIKGLSKHLSKCMNKKLLGKEYKICEYNSYHIIKNNLYDFHLISCPSRKKFEECDNDSDDDDLKIKETSDEEKPIENNKTWRKGIWEFGRRKKWLDENEADVEIEKDKLKEKADELFSEK